MKVAIVHYWLVNMRGGEKVVEALCELFPNADIFTHVYTPGNISDAINRHKVTTTFIQNLPAAGKRYKTYLPLMPLALERLDLRPYDLVISSESGPAKGVITRPGAVHLCYCHTPMRYVWDMYHDYFESAGAVTKKFMPYLVHYLRMWDYASAARVDEFITNSRFVAGRIKKHYRRDAMVIHPPVSTGDFHLSEKQDDFYLMAGQLVRYKRADLAVEAFNRTGRRLVVIGDGEQRRELEKIAGPNVTIMGRKPAHVIADHYSRCRALIFPGIEDFGIVPVEAMASGRPVIAFRKGGVLETVLENRTGLFFDEQTPESLLGAVRSFEKIEHGFNPGEIARHARIFDEQIFKDKITELVGSIMNDGMGRACKKNFIA